MREEEAKKVMNVIAEISTAVQNARRETAEEIYHWFNMHLLTRPDRPMATLKFTDWMKFKRMLKTKYGITD